MIKAKAKVPLMMTLATILCGTLLGASFTSAPAREGQRCRRQSRQLPDIGGRTNSCEGRHRTLCSLSNEAPWKTGKRGLTGQRKGTRQQSNAPFNARALPATLPGDGRRENKVRRAPWRQDYQDDNEDNKEGNVENATHDFQGG